MTAAQATRSKTAARPIKGPPLVNGDRMTRAEFERRWEQMPELKRAELINGMVLMAAATRAKHHGQPHGMLVTVLGYYATKTPGIELHDASSIRLDEDNAPQPDAALLIPRGAGGQARIDEDDYIAGGPELVAEVSASTVSIDLHDKFDVYRRHGVREYVVWRVVDREIDWFVLREGQYERIKLARTKAGRKVYRSEVFPGLWLDVRALLDAAPDKALKSIDEGVIDPAHAAFVDRLCA